MEQLLGNLREVAKDRETICVGQLLDAAGRPSFGPLLLLAGIVTVAPIIGDIPGVPTIIGIFVFLVAIQLLMKREHIWLAHKLLNYSVSTSQLDKILDWGDAIAKRVDRWLRPRLTSLTQGMGAHFISALCPVIAVAMPPMELIPFSANAAGAALVALGLASMANDGLWAASAFVIVIGAFGLVAYNLL